MTDEEWNLYVRLRRFPCLASRGGDGGGSQNTPPTYPTAPGHAILDVVTSSSR